MKQNISGDGWWLPILAGSSWPRMWLRPIPNPQPRSYEATAMPFGEHLTTMVTPFAKGGHLDHERAARLARHLLANGSDGLVVSGSTGESSTLTDGERLALFSTIVEAVAGGGSVVANTGTNDTHHTIELTMRAAELGVDGVMVVTPYYSLPSQSGILAHFASIADATALPLIVDNDPLRTGRLIEIETLAEMAQHPNIIATKDSVDDIDFTAACRASLPDDFAIYAGTDRSILRALEAGAIGAISVAGHFAGRQIKRLIQVHGKGDVAEAERLHLGLGPIFEACRIEPDPMPTKAGLNDLWESVGDPRLPLLAGDPDVREAVAAATGLAQKL